MIPEECDHTCIVPLQHQSKDEKVALICQNCGKIMSDFPTGPDKTITYLKKVRELYRTSSTISAPIRGFAQNGQ